MSISDETIQFHLSTLLDDADADAALHRLHVLAYPTQVGPLGVPLPPGQGAPRCSVYVIDAAGRHSQPEEMIGQTIMHAFGEHSRQRERIDFAAISFEVWAVQTGDDEGDALAERLHEQGRLSEHPDMFELTIVYGVCRDGRRWRGERWHTDPSADNHVPGAQLLTGRPDPNEWAGQSFGPLLLWVVGIHV